MTPAFRGVLHTERLVALALLLLGVGCGIASLNLGLWAGALPGIGMTSFLASVILVPIAAILLLRPPAPSEDEALMPVPIVCGLGFLVYVAALEWAGLLGPTVAFVLVWAGLVYRRSILESLIAALLITGAIYVVFVRLLSIPIPLWPA